MSEVTDQWDKYFKSRAPQIIDDAHTLIKLSNENKKRIKEEKETKCPN